MAQHVVRRPAGSELASPLTVPRLVRSSDGLGWQGFAVRTYDEPAAMEGWRASGLATLTLVLVTSGAMQMEQRRLDGPWQSWLVRPGDLLLRPPGRAPYEVRWTVCSPEPMRTLHIHVQPELVLRTAAALGGDPGRHEVVEQVGVQDPLLAQIGLRLGAALETATPADALYAQAAVELLVAHVLRYHAAGGRSAPDPQRGLTHGQVQRVSAFVQAHLHLPLTLEELAAQVGYSPYHFARLFRQAVGASPYQFVLRERVAQAQQLLRAGALPLAEVALACGFANQGHMTRVFRRQVGATPLAYRRSSNDGAAL